MVIYEKVLDFCMKHATLLRKTVFSVRKHKQHVVDYEKTKYNK